MDTKEKIVSKEEMIRLIDEGRFFEFFEAIDGSEWKYDKPIYSRLKENFMRGIYDIDFANRLNVFVSTLEDKPINNDIIENDKLDIKDILGKIKKLKFNTSILAASNYNVIWFSAIYFAIGLYMFSLPKLRVIDLTVALSILIPILIWLIYKIVSPLLLKKSQEIYQFLVPIAAKEGYSTEESEIIENAKQIIIKFADLKSNIDYQKRLRIFYGIMIILVLVIFITFGQMNRKNSTNPHLKTYIYSPSFDSLLQNDKKVYQYVDSLVQKHKK